MITSFLVDIDDYTGLSGSNLPFSACQNRSCVNITIHDDMIVENVESFTVTLERTPGLDMRITLDQVEAGIEITDDDGEEFTVYAVTRHTSLSFRGYCGSGADYVHSG